MKVAICIITYKRPNGLRRLLEGINRLIFEKTKSLKLQIIVVDNDLNGGASAFCKEIRDRLRWPLRYFVEGRRGISFARNKAIACARDNVDFIAFIDDDEVPEPCWLDELLCVQQLYKADVVTGPVIPRFEQEAPFWFIKGRFRHGPRYPMGHPLLGASTGNVLIRFDIFKNIRNHFDERLALTGGEDSDFFSRVYHTGYSILWADSALVYELIPKSRANLRWLLQRSYRYGNTRSFFELKCNPLFSVRLIRIVKATGRIILGCLALPLSFSLGWHMSVKTLQFISKGAGMMTGVFGMRYEEYRKIHGS